MNKPAIAALLCMGVLPAAQAVSLPPDGRGQALIYPYYTVQDNNDTLFSIVVPNSDLSSTKVDQGKALKVRFYEGRNGRVVLDFNLYLAENTTWTSLSEILCVRHTMSKRSMYAKQDAQEEAGGGTADHPERTH